MSPPTQEEFGEMDQQACPICDNTMTDPVETPCQHYFCSDCLEGHLETSTTCPTCGTELFEQEDLSTSKHFGPSTYAPTLPPAAQLAPLPSQNQVAGPTALPQYMRPGTTFGNLSMAPALPAIQYSAIDSARAQHYRAVPMVTPESGTHHGTAQGDPLPPQQYVKFEEPAREVAGVKMEEDANAEEYLEAEQDVKSEESVEPEDSKKDEAKHELDDFGENA